MAHCERCERWFGSYQAFWQHERTSGNHHFCDACDRDFVSDAALIQHYSNSSRHTYCTLCDELLDDLGISLNRHDEEVHYECMGCNMVFRDEVDMLTHCRDVHHDRWCAPCRRMFQNENNLRQHLRSATHQPANFACPMKGCGRSFISTAALVLHLESGTCASGMTRAMVDRLVRQYDKRGVITDPSRLIQGPGASGSSPQVTRTWATDRAWNGSAYECYLCHKAFRSLTALNAHLGSPVHSDKLYRCPRDFGGCGTEFRTMSAFCQHVEHGQCGVHRFAGQLRKVIDGVTKGGRLLTGG
ncbi:hypothetical protein LXA43DRAFT_428146 [Ganoderma leucocontextum]|nr:hypothetical protein LXA43DRAFT_428146 [Ganoderma leucocontextum]